MRLCFLAPVPSGIAPFKKTKTGGAAVVLSKGGITPPLLAKNYSNYLTVLFQRLAE